MNTTTVTTETTKTAIVEVMASLPAFAKSKGLVLKNERFLLTDPFLIKETLGQLDKVSRSMLKKIAKKVRNVKNKPTMYNYNKMLYYMSTQLYINVPKLDYTSEYKEMVDAKKAWKKALAESDKLLKEYKEKKEACKAV